MFVIGTLKPHPYGTLVTRRCLHPPHSARLGAQHPRRMRRRAAQQRPLAPQSGRASPGADVPRGEPPSPGADVAGASPVPVQMWRGRVPTGAPASARSCGPMSARLCRKDSGCSRTRPRWSAASRHCPASSCRPWPPRCRAHGTPPRVSTCVGSGAVALSMFSSAPHARWGVRASGCKRVGHSSFLVGS